MGVGTFSRSLQYQTSEGQKWLMYVAQDGQFYHVQDRAEWGHFSPHAKMLTWQEGNLDSVPAFVSLDSSYDPASCSAIRPSVFTCPSSAYAQGVVNGRLAPVCIFTPEEVIISSGWKSPSDPTAVGEMCLEVQNGATDDGSQVQFWDCAHTCCPDKAGRARWMYDSENQAVINVKSGKCLTTIGHQLQIHPCNNGDNQRWSLVHVDDPQRAFALSGPFNQYELVRPGDSGSSGRMCRGEEVVECSDPDADPKTCSLYGRAAVQMCAARNTIPLQFYVSTQDQLNVCD
jgi:hypothetical protein